ncbi:MAG: hypothetical protein ACFFCS_10965 [Candidatus Hodarchaeota archaeon]
MLVASTIVEKVTYLAQLIWKPSEIKPINTFEPNKSPLVIGLWAGLVGLGIQLSWIIPEGLISISAGEGIELLVNKISGALVGILLVLILWGFESIFLRICRFHGFKRAIQGSLAVFLVVPAACIPIHAWFPAGLTVVGYNWMFWVLAGFFVTWHVSTLFTLLASGNFNNKTGRTITRKKHVLMGILLVIIEIALAITFFVAIPYAFGNDFAEFMVEWI